MKHVTIETYAKYGLVPVAVVMCVPFAVMMTAMVMLVIGIAPDVALSILSVMDSGIRMLFMPFAVVLVLASLATMVLAYIKDGRKAKHANNA